MRGNRAKSVSRKHCATGGMSTGVVPRGMAYSTEAVLVALLSSAAAFLGSYISLYDLPEAVEAGILSILFIALVGILLFYDARVSVLRCACSLILSTFIVGVLFGLIHNPQKLRAALFGTMISTLERDMEEVLAKADLQDALAVLRSNGVFNLETLRTVCGEGVDVPALMSLGFPFGVAHLFASKCSKLITELEYRAKVRKEYGNQRLYDAAREYLRDADSFAKMRDLIKAGSHPDGYKNKDGWTALIWASCNGHAEVVRFLLGNGANVDVQGYDGWSALLWASHNGFTKVAAMLLDAGAATDLQGESGGTALTRASDRGYPEIVRLLLERGANTDIQNSLGYTALMWGSARGHVEVVRMLLQAGARLDLVNIDGDSALIEACRKSHVEVIQLLLAQDTIKHAHIQRALPFVKRNSDIAHMLLNRAQQVQALSPHQDTEHHREDGGSVTTPSQNRPPPPARKPRS